MHRSRLEVKSHQPSLSFFDILGAVDRKYLATEEDVNMGCPRMKVKLKSLIVVIFVLMSAFYLASMILPVNVKASTLFVGGTGPGNYTTIQSAIDNAAPGDTIYVFNGVYPERIEVNKTLSLVGEDRDETIIDGMGLGYVVNVTADWVNITGFKVMVNGVQTMAGIHLYGVRDCFIANNNVSNVLTNGKFGILLDHSNNNTVTNNVLWNNSHGIYLLFFSNDNDVVGNTVSSGNRNGITLLRSDNNTIADNFVSRNFRGIALFFSTDNTLVNNTAMNNVDEGIYLRYSNSNEVINNTLSSSNHGIHIRTSDNNTVSNNNAWDNEYVGIALLVSDGNTVADNLVTLNNQYGITLAVSRNNSIHHNNIINNSQDGIYLWWGSTGNTLANNTVLSNNDEGIYLNHSDSNDVINNAISSSYHGIYFRHSDNNTATDNYVWNNENGFWLLFSDGNTVADNSVILNSQYGIRINDSNNNTIHHNNIINNSLQADDDMDTNQWDDGYPSGGNYWSDYAGVDLMSGPNQDIPGSDGKGDTPYVIDADSEDRYPLVTPVPRPPSAPLNLSAFPGDQQIALTWDPPSFNGSLPITNYRIYRGTAPGGEVFFAEIGNVLTHLDTGLTNGQMYCYRVSAVNGVGEGPLSNEACATPSTTPEDPLGLNAVAGDQEVTLNWTAPSFDGGSTITNYRIYRGNSSGTEVFLTEVGNINNYTDANLVNGQTYYYQVSAVNSKGEGPLSNEANATPSSTPGSPGSLQAELIGLNLQNVKISWSLSSDDGAGQRTIVAYTIYRNSTYDACGTNYQQMAFLPNGTAEYMDVLAGEGDPNNYFYQICAVDLNNLVNCSANQAGKFTRSLLNGPNLVSIPLIQSDENIETVLQTLKWDKAWTYDSSAQKWKSHMMFKPYKGELEEVNTSMGIWVNVTEQSNLTVAGVVPSTTSIYLHAGWNLVGFPSFNGTYAVSDLKATLGVERMEGFEALTPPYFLRALTDGDVFQTGFGYWIKTSSDVLWTVINS